MSGDLQEHYDKIQMRELVIQQKGMMDNLLVAQTNKVKADIAIKDMNTLLVGSQVDIDALIKHGVELYIIEEKVKEETGTEPDNSVEK